MKLACTAIILAFASLSSALADHHLSPVALEGVWKVQAESDQGARDITWTFRNQDGKLKGKSLDHQSGEDRELDRIRVKDKAVTIEVDIEADGNTGVIEIEAKETAFGKLKGDWAIVGDDGTEYMRGTLTAVKEVSYAGKWTTKVFLPDGNEMSNTLVLKGKSNNRLTGEIVGENNTTTLDAVSVKNNQLVMKFRLNFEGMALKAEISAAPQGNDKLVGMWSVDGDAVAEGDWEATRKVADVAGVWKVVAPTPDGQYEGTLTLKKSEKGYSGTSAGNDGQSSKVEDASFKDGKLTMTIPFERDGYTGEIVVKAELQDDGSLKGEWEFVDIDGSSLAGDSWTAKRK